MRVLGEGVLPQEIVKLSFCHIQGKQNRGSGGMGLETVAGTAGV